MFSYNKKKVHLSTLYYKVYEILRSERIILLPWHGYIGGLTARVGVQGSADTGEAAGDCQAGGQQEDQGGQLEEEMHGLDGLRAGAGGTEYP